MTAPRKKPIAGLNDADQSAYEPWRNPLIGEAVAADAKCWEARMADGPAKAAKPKRQKKRFDRRGEVG